VQRAAGTPSPLEKLAPSLSNNPTERWRSAGPPRPAWHASPTPVQPAIARRGHTPAWTASPPAAPRRRAPRARRPRTSMTSSAGLVKRWRARRRRRRGGIARAWPGGARVLLMRRPRGQVLLGDRAGQPSTCMPRSRSPPTIVRASSGSAGTSRGPRWRRSGSSDSPTGGSGAVRLRSRP